MTTQAPTRAAARPNSLNPARRFSVRLTLATGATLATLLGSQTLSTLETPAPTNAANGQPPAAQNAAQNAATAAPALDVHSAAGLKAPAAPILVIVRNPNGASSVIAAQKGSANVAPQRSVVQAPPPSFSAPPPVVASPSLMQPMPLTRSSR